MPQVRVGGADAAAVVGLDGTDDSLVYRAAVEQRRVVVTENFADFAAILERRLASDEPCVAIAFVRKRRFPRGSALAAALARHLHDWATDNPEPYSGVHWP